MLVAKLEFLEQIEQPEKVVRHELLELGIAIEVTVIEKPDHFEQRAAILAIAARPVSAPGGKQMAGDGEIVQLAVVAPEVGFERFDHPVRLLRSGFLRGIFGGEFEKERNRLRLRKFGEKALNPAFDRGRIGAAEIEQVALEIERPGQHPEFITAFRPLQQAAEEKPDEEIVALCRPEENPAARRGLRLLRG